MWTVLTQEHLYSSLFFGKGDKWDLSTQLSWTLRAATNFTFLMFAVTFIFDLQFPNNKSICTSKTTYEQCLSVENIFDRDQSTCYWYLTEHINDVDIYSCEYKEVRLTAWGVALMSLLVSCLVFPASFIFDYIFNHFIIVPVKEESPNDDLQDLIVVKLSIKDRVLSFISKNKIPGSPSDDVDDDGIDLGELSSEEDDDIDIENNLPFENAAHELDNLMSALVTDIRVQRQHIDEDSAEYFDANWRWNHAIGNFTNSEKKSNSICCSRSVIEVTDEPPVVEYDADAPPFRTLHYMKTQQEVVETIDMCDDLKNSLQCSSDEVIATLLLNLFVMDYLGRENLSSKVFAEQQRQLLNPHPPVTLHRKCVAMILIVGANTAFLTYVILQNLFRENSYQTSFLVLYCIQFAVEFFWYEALICVWMFYSIPLIISREVQAAISCLRECANKAFVHPDDICQDALNATHWFYVSTRMAEQFSHMLESQCVLAYHTYYRELATDRVAKSVKLEKDYFWNSLKKNCLNISTTNSIVV